MKKSFLIIFIIVVSILAACAAPASAATAPDFSGTDFSGVWNVSSLQSAGGTPATSGEMQLIGAGFTLELLRDGTYFVYNVQGQVLGQGQYSVSAGTLTCSAGERQTVYTITDAATLRCTSEDNTLTVMTKTAELPEAESPDEEGDVPEDSIAPEDANAPEEELDAPVDSGAPEEELDAPVDSGALEEDLDAPIDESAAP